MGWTNSKNISNVYTTIEDKILLRNTDNIENYFLENLGENYLNFIQWILYQQSNFLRTIL